MYKIFRDKSGIEKNGKTGFIFATYDGASFLWPDFFRLMMKFWPTFDSFFDSYISMAEKERIYVSERLTIEPVGIPNENVSFSLRLKKTIEKLNCEYVFIILDDFYQKSDVDVERLKETIALIKRNKKIDSIGYENYRIKAKDYKTDLSYLKRLKKCICMCNLQIAIWRSSSLKRVLRINESARVFEYYGSVRAWLYGLCVLTIGRGNKPIFDYDFGWLIEKGKFHKDIYDKYVNELNINSDMGDTIGYFESATVVAKKSLPYKVWHALLALLSFFRK